MLGNSIRFQDYDPNLKRDLLEIVRNYTNYSPYLLCVPIDQLQKRVIRN